MHEMVEVLIDSIRVSLMSPQRVVILRQKDKERYLPIWIGPYEAEAITVALQEVETARPMTHDLFKSVLKVFNAALVRVEITELKGDIFYGNLVLSQEDQTFNVDTRPSDAIALAIRFHAPILVHQLVMDEAGISPETGLQEEPSPDTQIPPAVEQATAPGQIDEDRLDVFEDFLKKLGGESDEDKPKE